MLHFTDTSPIQFTLLKQKTINNFETLLMLINSYCSVRSVSKNSLISAANGSENKEIAIDDDGKWNEEDEDEEEHSVSSHRRCEGHIIPGARGQQAFGNISTCKTETDRQNKQLLNNRICGGKWRIASLIKDWCILWKEHQRYNQLR